MQILLDASAIMAVIVNEQNKELVIKLTKGSHLLSSKVITYEIGNALISLYKRHRLTKNEVINTYNFFEKIPIKILDINISNALKISCTYNIYAYDAYYLEVAKRLNLPLLTFDVLMKKVAFDMNIKVLSED
ncbi:MAG: type II toxin-antitoxin system VapC family toxin [Lactobacillales bacterium]|jgi:predicted nucleic acid-binding protein|nr:type II toxin-antitoxin system VapC family toxin [Lactobacillales bacterium]